MHETSTLWKQIFAETGHQKEIKVAINGVEYAPENDRLIRASLSGSLFDAPSVGGAVSRTLELEIVPYDAPHGAIPPMSEIKLHTRLVSADGQRVSEYIPKGVFFSDTAKRDRDTGAVTVTAFDAMLKMERPLGGSANNAVCRVTFYDGFTGYQHFQCAIGDAMPTPTTPTHTGETFKGWYPDPSDTLSVVSDMFFTARWAPKVERIEVVTPPTKTTYQPGDTLDYTGLSVVAYYNDGTSADVTSECEFDPEEGQTVDWEEAET